MEKVRVSLILKFQGKPYPGAFLKDFIPSFCAFGLDEWKAKKCRKWINGIKKGPVKALR